MEKDKIYYGKTFQDMHLYCKLIQESEKDGKILLRLLGVNDSRVLGEFFRGLSHETRSRFAPHQLSMEYASALCHRLDQDSADRFILISAEECVGYFILDPVIPIHEADRFRTFGISLESYRDCMFAPCMADNYQGRGLATKSMPFLLDHCLRKGYRSLALLGGTQESNLQALQFYRKFGFKKIGGYLTEVYNIDMQLIF